MISLITVIAPCVAKYKDYFLASVKKNMTLISEVIVCHAKLTPDYNTSYTENGIEFKEIGSKYHAESFNSVDMSHEHSFALHHALEATKNELILISDPDILFYKDVVAFYYELMQRYKLNIIGIARNNPHMYVQGYFPSVFNMLVKKSSLPKDFVKVTIEKEYTDKFFAFNLNWRFDPPEFANEMANPTGWYDTGCLLYLWGKRNNWKWLSFLTGDLHNYGTQFYKSNFKLIEKLPREKLLYHQSASSPDDAFNQYKEAYDQSI